MRRSISLPSWPFTPAVAWTAPPFQASPNGLGRPSRNLCLRVCDFLVPVPLHNMVRRRLREQLGTRPSESHCEKWWIPALLLVSFPPPPHRSPLHRTVPYPTLLHPTPISIFSRPTRLGNCSGNKVFSTSARVLLRREAAAAGLPPFPRGGCFPGLRLREQWG